MGLPHLLGVKAEVLRLADRTSEALEVIKEGLALCEKFDRTCRSELYRLRAVIFARLGVDDAQIEEAFRGAIGTAKQQKSASLTARAEASYAEYRAKKARQTDSRVLASFPSLGPTLARH